MTLLPDFLTDISITSVLLPTELDSASARGVLWQAGAGRFLLDIPSVARYLVTAGNSITIDPAPEASASVVYHHLAMLPLAALLYQRGTLAIHAAVVANDQGAVLLTGDSGSGKSTLLMALLQRGWTMLADDLAIVSLDEHGQPVVYPMAPRIALWAESLEKLGIDSSSLSYVDANRRELIPLGQTALGPQRLRSIYHLGVHGKSEVELEEIAVGERFRAVGSLLYNCHVADVLCSKIDYLRGTAAVAQAVPINILRRPRGIWSVAALAEQIKIVTTGSL